MLDEKWLHTMEIYDEYEKRFAKTAAERQFYVPTAEEEFQEIIKKTKRMLAFDEKLIPEISNIQEVCRNGFDSYEVVQLKFTTWDNFHSSLTLYMPHIEDGQRVPLGFVFCGHGGDGRLTVGYQLMAERLARMGMAVVLPDNIGQGDRSRLGHRDAIAPFYCGLTLQGLILMESGALIRHFVKQSWVDTEKVSACGNSGGGTLCLFLAALAPEIKMLCPTGYSSDFGYLLAKERRHCACNLIPGCAYGPEMWKILSCFAPKPLMIEQGANDHLIPYDLFMRTARKVSHVYRQMGAEGSFSAQWTKEGHSWTPADRTVIVKFIAEQLGLEAVETDNEEILKNIKDWHIAQPADGLTTDQLTQRLTGKAMPEGTLISDIFKPQFHGRPIEKDELIPDIGRGDVMEILAQMECALQK